MINFFRTEVREKIASSINLIKNKKKYRFKKNINNNINIPEE